MGLGVIAKNSSTAPEETAEWEVLDGSTEPEEEEER